MTDVKWMTSKKIFPVKFNENMKDMFELIHKTKSTFDGASNIDFNRIGCSNPKNYFKWLSIYYMDIDREYYVKHEPNKLLMESQKIFSLQHYRMALIYFYISIQHFSVEKKAILYAVRWGWWKNDKKIHSYLYGIRLDEP